MDDYWPFIAVSIGLLLVGVFGLLRLWLPAAVVLGLSSAVWVGIAGRLAFADAIRGYSPGSDDFPIYSIGAIGITGLACAVLMLLVARHRRAWLAVGWLVTLLPVAALGLIALLLRHRSLSIM